MTTHKPDDEREFEAFLKGDHALSREYRREAVDTDAGDAVPESVDAMILRQAAEQAARQQRLQAPSRKPWYRQSWFSPASGVAIAAMVTVVMFYPAQVPLQQSESARMQNLVLEEAPARKLMQAPAAPEAVEADTAASSLAMHDAASNMAGAAQSDATEAGMLEEVRVTAREDMFEAKAMQAAPAPATQPMERQLAKRERAVVDPEWVLQQALADADWLAASSYLAGLAIAAEDDIAAVSQRIRMAIERQQLPEENDLNALYDWLQAHHPEAIHHDGQATSD